MSSTFYGYASEAKTNSSDYFLYETNENNCELFNQSRPGVYSLPYLFQKFLDKDYSRFFAQPKVEYNLKNIERGYYPGNLMGDISKAELHYQKLNEMFKLDA